MRTMISSRLHVWCQRVQSKFWLEVEDLQAPCKHQGIETHSNNILGFRFTLSQLINFQNSTALQKRGKCCGIFCLKSYHTNINLNYIDCLERLAAGSSIWKSLLLCNVHTTCRVTMAAKVCGCVYIDIAFKSENIHLC